MRRTTRGWAAAAALVLSAGLVTVPARADIVAVRTRDLVIPMTSGGFLRGDLYQPELNGVIQQALPTIVIYFPYSKDDSTRFERPAIDRFVQEGFAALLVDIRGTGDSPGAFGLLDTTEVRDGYDVVEWAATQPFSNGEIGMFGYSYPGLMAEYVAALQPPHLKAIVPAAALNDPYRDVTYPGGMFMSQDTGLGLWLMFHAMGRSRPWDTPPDMTATNMIDAATHPEGATPMALAPTHPLYDDFWKERSLGDRVEDIEIPALIWGGWDDLYPRGTWINMLQAPHPENRLVMGPWGHIGSTTGGAYALLLDESVRWFDIFLRTPAASRPGKLASIPKVRLFDTDWTAPPTYDGTWSGEWRGFSTFPPASDALTLELCSTNETPSAAAPWTLRGALGDDCASDGTMPVAGVPADALGSISATHDTAKGSWANPVNDHKDQRLSAAATAFLGEPLEQAVTISGPMVADLALTTAGADSDVVVRVVDVSSSSTRVISQGWLRASHRAEDPDRDFLWHTHATEQLLTPGVPYRMRVEIWPTSYRVAAGHRIGLLVQTADSLKVTGERGGTSSMLLVGPGHPSSLTIPARTDPGTLFTVATS